jgi:ATP-dependent helicase/nuclease subunit A
MGPLQARPGTEHILIDEAQDTNPRAMGRSSEALADEFFAGLGSHDEHLRTLFTVGDYKQAIFGFQGTSPAPFRCARSASRTWRRAAGHVDGCRSTHSFRSMPAGA